MHWRHVMHIAMIITCLVFGFKKPLHAQNERFKALFIYNFTKHILWPDEYNNGNFVIGVIGSSPIVNELNLIASHKKMNGQPILVERYSSPKQIRHCHILYIPHYNSSRLEAVVSATKNDPMVIVTDDYSQGLGIAGINFIVKDGFLDFEISRENLLKRGLKVNPKLFSLASENE